MSDNTILTAFQVPEALQYCHIPQIMFAPSGTSCALNKLFR